MLLREPILLDKYCLLINGAIIETNKHSFIANAIGELFERVEKLKVIKTAKDKRELKKYYDDKRSKR